MQVSSGATARDALLLHRYPHAMSAGARTRLYQAEIIQGLTERLDQLRRDHSAAGPHAAAGAA